MRFRKYAGLKAWVLSAALAAGLVPHLRSGDPPLLNIKDIAPGIRIEMRYATADNFTGKTLYPVGECLLCEPVARRLAQVQKNLEKKGLGLKVWDCYRPLSIQKKLWEIVPDPRYVADPRTGSRHNRGASVDLTLVDSRGNELPMPTGFDEFTERAHRGFDDLPTETKRNRALLQDAMEQEGFTGLSTEWWHFDAPEWSAFALRDEPLGSASLRKDMPAQPALRIPDDAGQLIVVLSSTWSSPAGSLQRYEREKGAWEKTGAAWDVSLGAKGMSWSSVADPGFPGPQKREGDKTAPAGIFRVGSAYGYSEAPPPGTKWRYQPVDEKWICIDDPSSSRYNTIFPVEGPLRRDWASAESMRRKDHLYKWVVNIEQNPGAAKGCGSCIFFHVWRKPLSPTEGCTAMHESHMVQLLTWLDPARSPHLLQLPQEAYADIKEKLRLP